MRPDIIQRERPPTDRVNCLLSLLYGMLRVAPGLPQPATGVVVALAARIRRHLQPIHNMLDWGLSNARIEAHNTHQRVLTRQGYGYRSAQALIIMAMLKPGGPVHLPGRS